MTLQMLGPNAVMHTEGVVVQIPQGLLRFFGLLLDGAPLIGCGKIQYLAPSLLYVELI